MIFGDRVGMARRFAELLVTHGLLRGALGPREPARIWSRHLLNCAVVSDLIGVGERVVDVGSGAGLPGIALAIRRPDLRVDLVEPMQRRVDFLALLVAELGLYSQVRVVRGRAEEAAVLSAVGATPWVTARAVAPLDRLVRWCVPLLAAGGQLALIKGSGAEQELTANRAALARYGAGNARVALCGSDQLDPPTRVITMAMVRTRASRRRS